LQDGKAASLLMERPSAEDRKAAAMFELQQFLQHIALCCADAKMVWLTRIDYYYYIALCCCQHAEQHAQQHRAHDTHLASPPAPGAHAAGSRTPLHAPLLVAGLPSLHHQLAPSLHLLDSLGYHSSLQ
jgi:hypothetical protein